MRQCKKCRAIISLNLADLMSGKFQAPKRISQDNKLYCDECFNEGKNDTKTKI